MFRALLEKASPPPALLRIPGSEIPLKTRRDALPSELDAFDSSELRVVQPRQNVIKTMLQSSGTIASVLLEMQWMVGRVPSRMSLLTTDSPLLLIVPPELNGSRRGIGIATPGVHKMIPLTRGLALFIGDFGDDLEFVQLTKGQVRANNLALASRCERFVIGGDEPLVQSVVRRTALATAARHPLIIVE